MSEKTKIAWCSSTINFWEGCAKVSAGCANCYAEARDKRFAGGAHWGNGAPRRKSKSAVKDALRLNRLPWICDNCGKAAAAPQIDKALPACECNVGVGYHRRRIFSLSLGDWLDPEIPVEWLAEMMDTIRQCDQVNWILCTKRPELWEDRMTLAIGSDLRREAHGKEFNDWLSAWTRGHAPKNVCALASVENQAMAGLRIPLLLRIPARWRGLSCEPLIGPLDLAGVKGLQWIIVGGESGPNARPVSVRWIRGLVEEFKAAGVATFVKQLGANVQTGNCTCGRSRDVNCPYCAGKMRLKHPKGGAPSEWPADLRVQEWPEGL